MGLRKAGGEMYPWADWTWNPLGGKCPHDCSYCYMKSPPACFSSKYNGEQRIIEQEMKVNLERLSLNRREILPFVGNKPVIFVCSGNDLGIAPLGQKEGF
jgi:DNA repair photolyase